MGYPIDLAQGAKGDIRALNANHRAEILDALERHVVDRPDVEEGRKKYLATLGTWQLSVAEHRVWYDVTGGSVTVTVVFHKGRLPTTEALAHRRKP
jgi:mRNA-degrading endonuclease RelE of RelBE toxin-antitoxin system